MDKLNCWQYKNCGREKDGLLADTLGVCPVAAAMKSDGLNGGLAAGRSCWLVSKNSCLSPGSPSCHDCEFYRRVMFEEQTGATGKFHSVSA